MKYLMIENPGICPAECFTLLGVSTSRNSGNTSVIGTFGSGSKHSISLIIRKTGYGPIIYCGRLCLEFLVKRKEINDGISSNTFHQVLVKLSGRDNNGNQVNRTEDLGWVLEHGVSDWNDINMAYREFTANALDRAIRENKKDEVVIEYVDENKVRAKTGGNHTRIFIRQDSYTDRYLDTINKRFLHFTNKDGINGILIKQDRNVGEIKSPVIYKKGVRIREMDKEGLFDYNFGDELSIDESRNAYSSDIKKVCLEKILLGKPGAVKIVVDALVNNKDVFEQSLSSYDIPDNLPQTQKDLWKTEWNKATNNKGVPASDTDEVNVILKDRGYTPVKLSEVWKKIIPTLGIKTVNDLLSKDDIEGMKYFSYTPEVIECFWKVWTILIKLDIINKDRREPEVHCFTQSANKDTGVQKLGYAEDGKVYINKDIVEDEELLMEAMLEEIFHIVSGWGDFSRGFQCFYFKVMAKMLLECSC